MIKEKVKSDLQTIEGINARWRTILYNCNCHSMNEVVKQLVLCGLPYEEAKIVMLEAHTKGRAIVVDGEREKCVKVARILKAIGLEVEVDRF